MAALNDIDGDGVPDFAVAAARETVDGIEQAGRVYWVSGADLSIIRTVEPFVVIRGGFFGASIDNAGDYDGDGKEDVVVGAFAPASYVLSSDDGSVLLTLNRPTEARLFGRDIATLGDTDGDGVTDFAVASPSTTADGVVDAGKAYVFSGADGALRYELQSPNLEALGGFARRLAALADVTRDGVPDVVVGAYLEDAAGVEGSGRVYVFSGTDGRLVATLSSPLPRVGGQFGWEQADAGDVNGDGFPDLLVGARGERRAHVFSGRDGQLIRTLRRPFVGVQFPSEFGRQVTTVGDLDGDGVADHLVSALNGAYLYSGATGTRLSVFEPTFGDPLNQFYGSDTAAIDDLNGDRVPDLLVGSFGVDVEGIRDAGGVYLYETVPPVLEAEPATVDFGAVPRFTPSDPETVTLTNTGGVFLTVDEVRLRQNRLFSQFSLDAPATPFVLEPGASAELVAGYRPILRKARARVEIASSDPATPLTTVFLRGRADDTGLAQADLAAMDGAEAHAAAPVDAALEVYPNPAHSIAEVRFGLAEATPVRVTLYDVLGREVAVLTDAQATAGPHVLTLDAGRLPGGVYFVQLATARRSETLRLVVPG